MSFRDIYDVSPFLSWNPLYRGPSEDVEQPGWPRLFKSHNHLMEIDGGKHIVTIRDPGQTLRSLYDFWVSKELPFVRSNSILWLWGGAFLPHSVLERWLPTSFKTLAQFAGTSQGWKRRGLFGTSFANYISEFWLARNDPDILLICYEDLVGDQERWIRAIGRFMGLTVSANLTKTVLEMSTKAFMSAHSKKFDESAIADEVNARGLFNVPFHPSERVRKGKNAGVDASVESVLASLWDAQVLPLSGIKTYADMRAQWNREVAASRPELFA